VKVEDSVEIQKNPIIESTAKRHHHNKPFPHNNNNHHHPNPTSKNYLNKKKSIEKDRSSSSTSLSPIPPLSVNTCPNCNARILEKPTNAGCNKRSLRKQSAAEVPFSKYRPSFWFLHHPLSMDPEESSSNLHRKRDDEQNGDGADDDDDQPRDSLEDTQVRGAGRQAGENYADKDGEEDNGELSREDLLRFLLSNSSGGRQYQFLQHQLQQQHHHQQQQHYAGGGGGGPHFHREVSASSSLHGAVGGMGLEPIMDASFQDDFDDIHSDYQWFTESG